MTFIPVACPDIGEEEAQAVYEVVRSGWISMGKKVREFEEMIGAYTGAKHAIAMNNGTSTLHALLMAMDIGPGDEVIVPSLTYISSANVVLFVGAHLVLCDSDPRTFNVEIEQVRRHITPRTKAIMVVDLKGMPCDFDGFAALSAETGIPVIADSAESLGALYKGSQVGTQLTAHSFSFFANKNVTTGEGGMVMTNDSTLYEKLLIIRNQGQEGRYRHTQLGNNFRMTDVLATLGIEQAKKIEKIIEAKDKLAKVYTQKFAACPQVTPPLLPDYVTRHSWYNYSIIVDIRSRDRLVEHLKEKQIETRVSFPPVHIQPYYVKRFGYQEQDFPKALQAGSAFIDLPIWYKLDPTSQDRIVEEICTFFSRGA